MTKTMFKTLKRLFAVALFAPAVSLAAPPSVPLDRAPVSTDPTALQHGAKLFVNYCLNCHGMSFKRYNKLTEIGLTEDEIRDNFVFDPEGAVGDLMTIAMRPSEGSQWFGTAPPDLTLVALQRAGHTTSGADWLYTYMRTFYRDPSRPTGWNNLVFENVGMPHVFWELQGDQVARLDSDGEVVGLELASEGLMSAEEYDQAMADLVSFLVWAAEPHAETRKRIGIFVLLFLAGFTVLAYLLKKNYWKDIH